MKGNDLVKLLSFGVPVYGLYSAHRAGERKDDFSNRLKLAGAAATAFTALHRL